MREKVQELFNRDLVWQNRAYSLSNFDHIFKVWSFITVCVELNFFITYVIYGDFTEAYRVVIAYTHIEVHIVKGQVKWKKFFK